MKKRLFRHCFNADNDEELSYKLNKEFIKHSRYLDSIIKEMKLGFDAYFEAIYGGYVETMKEKYENMPVLSKEEAKEYVKQLMKKGE